MSRCLSLGLAALLLAGCAASEDGSRSDAKAPDPGAQLFTRLPSNVTGVRFENRLTETNERNVFTYRNYYNGGGTAIGDLSGDGLPEIVLTANEGGPRLYLNGGKFRFRDITAPSGLKTVSGSWTTGVALADVNGDGRLDVYVSRAGPVPPEKRANALWINQGAGPDSVPRFRDMAEQYGIADQGYSIHAAFLDVDRDGDLDLFVMNNSPRPVTSFGPTNTRDIRDPYGSKLYRNDGARFTDVSVAAGIHSPEFAFGLGLVVADVNRDGWPDIYVANDFHERDYLYVNKRDGTFADVAEQQMPVMSYFSMGLDVGDVDNDGWPDIYTTDMLPEDELRLKMTSAFESWEQYQTKVRNGYHHQLSRNMLQRNNRDGTFSDVGQIAGVARTDWTWSALIADLDLDGRKDVYVTNGMARDVTAQDYLAFLASDGTMRAARSGGKANVDFLRLIQAMPSTPLRNYAFHNLGDLRFTNEATSWGLAEPSFSSGAAYGDLDGDGALDLVTNNVNGEAFVYRNNARTLLPQNGFLRVRLEGQGLNRFGVGARVTVFHGGGRREEIGGRIAEKGAVQMQEQLPARGYQSSVDYTLVFGLGPRDSADSVRVDWPDGRVTTLGQTGANQLLTISQTAAAKQAPPSSLPPHPLLQDVTGSVAFDYRHQENEFVDFDRERLMPKLLSTEGPHVAVADVNGDGLEDLFLGGAKGQPGKLLLQQPGGRFASSSAAMFATDAISEDVGAAFFDANGDRRPDLFVVSGGSEYSEGAPGLQDRLYLTDGRGTLRKAEGHVPSESSSGSRVVAADYDADGDIDLFVGGRVVPWRYGLSAHSALLRNDGRGGFTDVTAQLAPDLAGAGMVTDAVWRDVDGDGRTDLVVVGEWMPITIFVNAGAGRLTPRVVRGLEKSHGWWNRIVAGDFTGDGRLDFVVGNLGLNSRLRASDSQPATMHVKDFDGNGFVEQIVSVYNGGVSYPLPLRDELLATLPFLRPRFSSYKAYALRTVADIFSAAELEDAVVRTAYTFATSLARGNADGSFTLVPLPAEAQLAPVYGILADDVDGDGKTDLLLAGNFDGFKPEIGRLASSYGLVLLGDGKGAFRPLRAPESGFVVPGQARDIQRMTFAGGKAYVVTRNNDTPLVFRPARPTPR
jgi:enediyne biosynthesis protein E4